MNVDLQLLLLNLKQTMLPRQETVMAALPRDRTIEWHFSVALCAVRDCKILINSKMGAFYRSFWGEDRRG